MSLVHSCASMRCRTLSLKCKQLKRQICSCASSGDFSLTKCHTPSCHMTIPPPHRPSYPCDMVTVLHVVLFKTADLDYATRERATHLHQILDRRSPFSQSLFFLYSLVLLWSHSRFPSIFHFVYFFRFFVSSEEDNDTGRRTDMLGCLTAGAYSQCHMTLSRELAIANPELTLPMFCGVFNYITMKSLYYRIHTHTHTHTHNRDGVSL